MPRDSRKHSATNIYHVMMRGNEKKNIFIDDEDRNKFIDILYNKKELSSYSLYAYCIMSNHVHLLMKEKDEEISLCLKRINISYAYYFNKKNERIGHLFQDRFRSECIETDSHLLSVVRYIHNNPVAAKIVERPEDYLWSSYNIYTGIAKDLYLIDMNEILSLFSSNTRNARLLFTNFSNQKSDEVFMDCHEDMFQNIFIHGIRDAKKYIGDYFAAYHLQLGTIKDNENMEHRKRLIAQLKIHSNLSIRDISQVLDINRGVVERTKV